jgi:large subunit ribosomal protein L28
MLLKINIMTKICDLLVEKSIMSGNNVSHSNRKTKRKFYPNLKSASFDSEILGVKVKFKKLSTKAIRTINKNCGFDNFIVNCRSNKLTDAGLKLKKQIIGKLKKSGKLDDIKLKSRKFIKEEAKIN